MTCRIHLIALVVLAAPLIAQDRPEDSGGLTAAVDQPEPGSAAWAFELLDLLPGFEKRLFAAEPLVMDPVSFCVDELGRVLVAESFRQESGIEDNRSSPYWLEDDLAAQRVEDRLAYYEKFADRREGGMAYYRAQEDRVRRLIDSDGDGLADRCEIVADGFDEPLDGTGAGVLALDGDVYYTCIPNLWLLEDSDGDGECESRRALATGFGVRTALRGHDMHGLVLGPDGRIYWSIGDRGYHLELPDGRVLHSPGTGAVFRAELDGRDLEVFHHGLRNPQELAFDRHGNLFTVDNNSDAGDRARLTHLVEGGETGWDMAYQTVGGENLRGPWNQERLWEPRHDGQPAWIVPPVANLTSGPSGLVAYPGLGLSARYDDHFLVCDFLGSNPASRILAFTMRPDGAGFALAGDHVFVDHVLATDVDFDFEGNVLISDWGSGWVSNREGRIYVLRDPEHGGAATAARTAEIMAEGMDRLGMIDLRDMIAHPDMRVRLRAQYQFARHGGRFASYLSGLAHDPALNIHLRVHSIWALGMISRGALAEPAGAAVLDPVVGMLQDPDPEIRAQIARVLGDERHVAAAPALIERLSDQSARVRYFAAVALGRLRDRDALPALVEMLRRNADADAILRHAGVLALHRIGDDDALMELAGDPDESVRLAALLALRRAADPRIARFLSDDNLAIVTEAARAIWDLPIDAAAAELAARAARYVEWDEEAAAARAAARPAHQFTHEVFEQLDWKDGDELRTHEIFTREPTSASTLESMESPRDLGDRFASRLRGEITVRQTGDHVFYVSSDDDSELTLSCPQRAGDAALPRIIARVSGWTSVGQWESKAAQVSEPIHLEAGETIVLEARHREGGGKDHVAVGWRQPDGTLERPIGAPSERRLDELPLARRVVAALLVLGGAAHARAVLMIAANPENPGILRREAAGALADWAAPSPRDRVLGVWRPVEPAARDMEAVRRELAPILAIMSETTRDAMAGGLLEAAGSLGCPPPDAVLARIQADEARDPATRVVALELRCADPANSALVASALDHALDAGVPALRATALEQIFERGDAAALELLERVLATGSIEERQRALEALERFPGEAAGAIVLRELERLATGDLPVELHLEALIAARGCEVPAVVTRLAAFEADLERRPPLDRHRYALAGGDAAAGRVIFQTHAAAQCIRCHTLAGEGGVIGPPLDGVASRLTSERILESLVDPQAAVVEGFGPVSPMPPMHLILTPVELRNVLAYAQTLRE